MDTKKIIINEITHYLSRIEYLQKNNKYHDYTKSINYYKNKIKELLKEL